MPTQPIPNAADFVIVGGGTAGLVLANRLAEDPSIEVLVLESGKAVSDDLIVPDCNASKAVIDIWAKLGNPKWTYDTLSPYYQKVYTYNAPNEGTYKVLGDPNNLTSPDGPLQLSFPSLPQKNSVAKAWNEVLRDMGYKTTAHVYIRQGVGEFYNAAGADPQTKILASVVSHFGGPASQRPNLTIVTKAKVLRVLISSELPAKMVAKSVEVMIAGETRSVKANREIILSAGASDTAKLLELSGVGEGSRLRSLDIPIVIENAAVGENLQNQVSSGSCFELEQQVEMEEDINSLLFPPLQDRIRQKEILDDNAPSATSRGHDFYNAVRATLESSNETCCSMSTVSISRNKFADLGVTQVISFSRGSSHIVSANPDDKPHVDPRLFSNSLDLEMMAYHLLALEQLPSTSPLSAFFKKDGLTIPGIAPITDLDMARKYVRERSGTKRLSGGTAAMLPIEKGGVVGQDLIVYGTSNLRVVDASIFPLIPQANPMATVYAVAERAADLIKGVGV